MKKNMMLCNGRSADHDFLNLIRVVVAERLRSLPPGAKFPLKDICGEDFWKELDDGERRTAGHCMMHLVKTGELPLIIAESRHEYPVYYQLK